MKTKLTKKEKGEELFVTIGRLRTILTGYSSSSTERNLALFEKIVMEVENMDLRIMRLERGDSDLETERWLVDYYSGL